MRQPSTRRAQPFVVLAALAAVAVVIVLVGCGPAYDETGAGGPDAALAGDELVARGAYLVTLGGCGDCHTPLVMGPQGPQPDPSRFLAGHPEVLTMPAPPPIPPDTPWGWIGAATNTAFAGPWGVTFATNLTPDEATGIGAWTEEIFIQTMRTGRHWGQSRPIMPPMPWQNLARATDQDLRAMFAFLRSLPPIANRVPDYQPPGAPPADAAGEAEPAAAEPADDADGSGAP